ncbi:probable G-protein coupled receptor Mth-like 5 [Chelonus insularis]|uniref:probable G-protein coupled receptor Mth-like 5 n=1 Tax=Chelonus insularis TaxID=460826 RepID=UPI00158BB346|nr:probable G-protein coupled receptor Mth-like 5 [Chelonus insularis]
MHLLLTILFLGWPSTFVEASTGIETQQDVQESVKIGKCCELNEILVDDTCTLLSETNETKPWQPEFIDDNFPVISRKPTVKYQMRIGLPTCRSNEHQWPVYYEPHGQDRLAILTSGKLRHFVHDRWGAIDGERLISEHNPADDHDDSITVEPLHFDYSFGHYCADKAIFSKNNFVTTYAMICVPKIAWTDPDYLIKHIVDPVTRALAIACYLFVAIVYFVLPQLRDLVGNMITSMSLCLVTNQIAVTVRIFTQYASHISFLIADTVAYISLLAAFFWLNALGYFVWNTFRSRNVFLRVSDGRKYCYYSTYVWGSTTTISGTAIFAHFALETSKTVIESNGISNPQETIGTLGMSVIFTSIAFTIIVDFCFILTTASTIKQMRTYGRIHHKMKYSFRMFTLLFAFLSFGWLTLMISQLKYDHLIYFHIVVNLLQAFLVLYVCVFGQKRVTFLLRKTCNCCDSEHNTADGLDWGEEMTAINAGY